MNSDLLDQFRVKLEERQSIFSYSRFFLSGDKTGLLEFSHDQQVDKVGNRETNAERNHVVTSKLRTRILASFFVTIGVLIGLAAAVMTVDIPQFSTVRSHEKLLSVFCFMSVFMTLTASVILMGVVNCCCRVSRRSLIAFVCFIGFWEMSTFSGFLFLIKVNALIAIILPVQIFLVIGMVVFHGTRTDEHQHDNVNSAEEAYESEIDRISELSLLTKALSFGLQFALILAYVKNSSFQERTSRADLSVTYLASTLGLCPTMISCMPLRFSFLLIRTLKFLNCATLVPLAWIAMILAAEFLDGLVVLSTTPLLIACVIFIWFDGPDQLQTTAPKPEGTTPDDSRSFIKEFKAICVGAVVVVYYAILIIAYCMYLGTEKYPWHLKAFVYFLLVAIISGLILTPQVFKPRSSSSDIPPTVVKILIFDTALVVPIILCPMAYFAKKLYGTS